ncbi:hypothetical protein ATANTOWER_030261 [Ataeniobius toweri]|uniref:SCP domain-containing protein n=1 Tax=Ataeniobius toweri TaxID=208326 RepID=A0ABU7AT74_9TELE|nr:hypothetical protein [Ataeniobius toweri]
MADESFQKEFLESHNSYRALHHAPPLTFNSKLTAAAQKWADECLKKRRLGHSDSEDGENVYYMQSQKPIKLTGKEAVDSWYREIKDYLFNKAGSQPKTGKTQHTQYLPF